MRGIGFLFTSSGATKLMCENGLAVAGIESIGVLVGKICYGRRGFARGAHDS